MALLWGATVTGVLNKLPTLKSAASQGGQIDDDTIEDNLEIAQSWVIARVGGDLTGSGVPVVLNDTARSMVELGAAGLTAMMFIPEDDNGNSFGKTLWKTFEAGLEQLAIGVEREGQEPPIGERPAFYMPPPLLVQWRGF